MTGIVLHRPHFGRSAERVGDTLGGPLVIGREADADMAVVEDRVVGPVGFLDLVQRLSDEEGFEPVAGHEGECALEKVEAAERGELVEHQEETMAVALRSEEHTSELQSLMRISYAVFCLKKKIQTHTITYPEY